MILVKMRMDTNDADYVYGFRIFEDNDWEYVKRITKKLFDRDGEVNGHVLNQDITWTSYEDWLGAYTEVKIGEAEFNTLSHCFKEKYSNGVSFGDFELPHEYADIEDDESDQ